MRKAVAAAILLAFLAVPTALAHASPTEVRPDAGTQLAALPTELRAQFDEPLDPRSTHLNLTNATGTPWQLGPLRFESRYELVATILEPLPADGYIVRWQTVSTIDGHPSAGAWAFAVGDAPVPPAGPTVFPRFPWPGAAAKTLILVGLGLVATGLLGAWFPPTTRREGHLALLGAGAHAVGWSLFTLVQADLVDQTPRDYLTTTQYGSGLLLRGILAGVLVLAAVAALRWRHRALPAASSAAFLLLLFSYGTASHAAARTRPTELGAFVDGVHMLAALAWIGALLLGVLRLPLSGDLDGTQRGRLRASARSLSLIALTSILTLTATGIAMFLAQVGLGPRDWRAFAETPYGLILLFKLLLVVAMVGFGVVNHFAFVKKYLHHHGFHTVPLFRANLRREAINGILILLLAATLTNLTAPAQEPEPEESLRLADPSRLLTISPGPEKSYKPPPQPAPTFEATSWRNSFPSSQPSPSS